MAASAAVTSSPMTPWPKTATVSPSRGCASCTRETAVSAAGRKAASAAPTSEGTAISPSAGTKAAAACGAKAKHSLPTSAAGAPRPTPTTSPTSE
eukprot:scaffold35440_cov36-Phaeocystis_antarctica.AAC.1